MAIKKKVGDAISAALTVEHRGQAIDIWATWVLWPGLLGEELGKIARIRDIVSERYSVSQSPNNGRDWQTVDLGTLHGKYPELNYEAEYKRADSAVALQDLANNPLIQFIWQDVYELETGVPVPELPKRKVPSVAWLAGLVLALVALAKWRKK